MEVRWLVTLNMVGRLKKSRHGFKSSLCFANKCYFDIGDVSVYLSESEYPVQKFTSYRLPTWRYVDCEYFTSKHYCSTVGS